MQQNCQLICTKVVFKWLSEYQKCLLTCTISACHIQIHSITHQKSENNSTAPVPHNLYGTARQTEPRVSWYYANLGGNHLPAKQENTTIGMLAMNHRPCSTRLQAYAPYLPHTKALSCYHMLANCNGQDAHASRRNHFKCRTARIAPACCKVQGQIYESMNQLNEAPFLLGLGRKKHFQFLLTKHVAQYEGRCHISCVAPVLYNYFPQKSLTCSYSNSATTNENHHSPNLMYYIIWVLKSTYHYLRASHYLTTQAIKNSKKATQKEKKCCAPSQLKVAHQHPKERMMCPSAFQNSNQATHKEKMLCTQAI